MSCYVIGDVHGSLCGLSTILDEIQMKKPDQIYFVGDLVGKGGLDWEVLDKVLSIPNSRVVLGNHDLYFLKKHYTDYQSGNMSEGQKRGYEYLCRGSLAIFHPSSDTLMVHAGIWPGWSLKKVLSCAAEIEAILRDQDLIESYFNVFYGNEDHWDDKLTGWSRVRAIINILTRIRTLNGKSCMDFDYTGGIEGEILEKSGGLTAWFDCRDMWPCRKIVFGHWAALNGQTGRSDCINIDKGYVYGGSLVAMNLETGQFIEVSNPKIGQTKKGKSNGN